MVPTAHKIQCAIGMAAVVELVLVCQMAFLFLGIIQHTTCGAVTKLLAALLGMEHLPILACTTCPTSSGSNARTFVPRRVQLVNT